MRHTLSRVIARACIRSTIARPLAAVAGLVVALVVFGLLADAPAMAQSTAVASWSGFYLGADAGARRAQSERSINTIDQLFTGPFTQHDLPTCTFDFHPCKTQGSYDNTAFRIGPYLGYNYQFGRGLIGIEGDWAWADKTVTQSDYKYMISVPALGPDSSFAVKFGWDASLRGRLGFLATPTLLLYGTAGVAWLKTDITSDCGPHSCYPGTFMPSTLEQSTVWTGWTIGGGVEAMLGGNWLVRGEYRYTDYGTKSFLEERPCVGIAPATCGMATSLNVGYDLSLRTQTVLLGIAYKFGGP
jgi:outer membrane immunogenic protein